MSFDSTDIYIYIYYPGRLFDFKPLVYIPNTMQIISAIVNLQLVLDHSVERAPDALNIHSQ